MQVGWLRSNLISMKTQLTVGLPMESAKCVEYRKILYMESMMDTIRITKAKTKERFGEPPSGFQGLISWLFLPAVAAGMYFDVPGEYLFIGAAVFATIFTIIELDKPDQPHNFEPEIYNMERGARDKLINDYNTMSIW
ncbi:hypothetical protein LWI29_030221 [Acer saccharum]|uniref:Uncharacterized protein n=1 Tax=Acer saccharum TaxID=4024 RepID=A0AA39TW14_ACESA|nr:hypothetical protein LWI29_030221 [Acer saccharum]